MGTIELVAFMGQTIWDCARICALLLKALGGADMASRTYKIGLYLAMHGLYRYMTTWQTKLQSSLTAPQLECFQAVLTAVTECLPLITPAPPDD